MTNAYHYANTFDDALSANFKGLLSMGFDPRQLSCLDAWLDAGHDYPMKSGVNAAVYRWNDKGIFQKHAVQTNEAQKPIYSVTEPSLSFNNAYLDWAAFSDTRIRANNQITLGIRLKLRSASVAAPQAIIAKGNYDTSSLYLDFFQTFLRYKLGNSGLATFDISTMWGQWITLILKASAGTLSLQINDQLVATSVPYDVISPNAAPLLIGGRTFQGAPSNFLSDCKIKHIAIFSSALSLEETALLKKAII